MAEVNIDVAQESTSQEILAKLNESGGVKYAVPSDTERVIVLNQTISNKKGTNWRMFCGLYRSEVSGAIRIKCISNTASACTLYLQKVGNYVYSIGVNSTSYIPMTNNVLEALEIGDVVTNANLGVMGVESTITKTADDYIDVFVDYGDLLVFSLETNSYEGSTPTVSVSSITISYDIVGV